MPGRLDDHDVIPNFSEIPSLLTSIRHPRRRAVSIGPQSEADAYETLAYREKRRRESTSEQAKGPGGKFLAPAWAARQRRTDRIPQVNDPSPLDARNPS